jgi:hypothetical protein
VGYRSPKPATAQAPDTVDVVDTVGDAEIDLLVAEYDDSYRMAPELRPDGDRRDSLRYAARIEAGLRQFLSNGGFGAFTTNFEDLGGLPPAAPVRPSVAGAAGSRRTQLSEACRANHQHSADIPREDRACEVLREGCRLILPERLLDPTALLVDAQRRPRRA